MLQERRTFDIELGALGLREYEVASPEPPPTLGFEFDVHYGFLPEVLADAGVPSLTHKQKVTNHTWAADLFKVTVDGTRLEIATKPFTADDAGKKELDTAVTNVKAFVEKLKKGCKKAKPKAIAVKIGGKPVSGKPRPFVLPDTAVTNLPVIRLPVNRKFHPSNCTVWASPQATVAVRLSKVDELVSAIRSSQGKGPGKALTGDGDSKRRRMGVRSDALFYASARVNMLFAELATQSKPLTLKDGTVVDASTLSEDLLGFLILLVMYLRTSELTYDHRAGQDDEWFAKAYLPLNVKAPFSAIFRELLSKQDQAIFREIFADKTERGRLFGLAKNKGTATGSEGSNKLFPAGPNGAVHAHQESALGGAVTWDDLVEHTLDSTHRSWGDVLLPQGSTAIGLDKTKPRVAIEMRRIGFDAVFASQWPALMGDLFALAKKLG